MVQELRELMRACADEAPYDDGDLGAVLRGGRRRVRVRRAGIVAGGALATAAVVGAASLVLPLGQVSQDLDSAGVPRPDGPVLHLTDAVRGVEGRDYETLFTHTNENLDQANGQYFSGVTDDGLLLYSDGPHGVDNAVRYALLDPATGDKDWLPNPPGDAQQAWAVELTKDRLVLMTLVPEGNGMKTRPGLAIFDRATRTWRTVTWPGLPASEQQRVEIGPDGRAYVAVQDRTGGVPKGGWPTGSDGEADDANAKGDVYHLWSASLTDPGDVRDEGLSLGDFAFTDTEMVWTDRTNGDAGQVHVRDLASGEERSFDPRSGDRCNLLSFGVTGEDVVMGQYCGTYDGSVRDDRVQVVTTDGEPVMTIQGNSFDGGIGGGAPEGGGLVTLAAYGGDAAGNYVYDIASNRLVRVSDGVSTYASGGGPLPAGDVVWANPVNGHKGQTQVLARWLR